jgi:hypothetical protein
LDKPCPNLRRGKTKARPYKVSTSHKNSQLIFAMSIVTLFGDIFTTKPYIHSRPTWKVTT